MKLKAVLEIRLDNPAGVFFHGQKGGQLNPPPLGLKGE